MRKLISAARFILSEFGPLIVFWALALTLGVKPAILGSILFILADAAWRSFKRITFTRLYLLVSALTLVFGAIDLSVASPFMLKYEGAVTNVATGLAFVVGALGKKPIIQEMAEKRGESLPATRGDPRLLPPVHALLGGLFLPQGRLLRLGRSGRCRCSRRWRCARSWARSASQS